MINKMLLFITLVTVTSCTSLKIKIGAKMSMKYKDNLEYSMNVRPTINKKPNGWSNLFKQNMNDAWKKLNIKGINYFLVGKPKMLKGYVTRSDVNSKFYQAWFGVYIIQAKDRVFSVSNDSINIIPQQGIMEYGKVAEHDQLAWLSAMGDKNPYAKSISYSPIHTIQLDGQKVQLFEGTIESHSDLTDKETSLTKLLGMPKPKKWKEIVSANHTITLKGIYGIWYNEKDTTIKIVYGCGSIVLLKDGTKIDHYSQLKKDIMIMAENITMENLK